MALQGTLKDFSITDIFQLIAQQGKSGSLLLLNGDHEAQVVFDKGNVVLARFSRGFENLRLGNLLHKAGVITADQLAVGLDEHQRQMKSLGDVLLAKQQISRDTLSEFLGLQTRETLFHVLQWKTGAYKFKIEDFHYNKQIIKPISSDFLLMDGVRQLDEWPALLSIIGSLDQTFELTSQADMVRLHSESSPRANGEDSDIDQAFASFDAAPTASATMQNISTEALQLLKIITSPITIQQLIDRSRLGTFETVRLTAELVQSNCLLTTQQPNSSSQGDPSTSGYRRQHLHAPLTTILSSCAVLLLLVAGLIFIARPIIIDEGVAGTTILDHSSVMHYRNALLQQQLQLILSTYYVENLDYPDRLDDLVNRGFITATKLASIDQAGFYYNKQASNYLLLMPNL